MDNTTTKRVSNGIHKTIKGLVLYSSGQTANELAKADKMTTDGFGEVYNAGYDRGYTTGYGVAGLSCLLVSIGVGLYNRKKYSK